MSDDAEGCGCQGYAVQVQHNPAHRRARWIVVLLNVGVGLATLAVNAIAAWIRPRLKEGDSNGRTVWLFSCNDALTNVAVIVAGGLVYWIQGAWPDVVVAAAIAQLFLHSTTEIINHARRELSEPAHAS